MAPDIPTVDEAGLPGFHVSTWYGLWAPKGTPRGHRREAQRGGASRRWPIRRCAQRLTGMGFAIPPRERQTPEALGAHHKAEVEKWSAIIRAAGVKAE